MRLNQYHLTYCTNIHPGEHWNDVQKSLQTYLPSVRQSIAPDQAFGIGLRLSHQATEEILADNQLEKFKYWLQQNNYYVFTMNAFPYGGFHYQRVKEDVHRPDWTQPERLAYTKRSFDILSQLLPSDTEGSISTSPLSYRGWYPDEAAANQARTQATHQLAQLVAHLYQMHQTTGQLLHVDLEPEPDGLLENTQDVIDYFNRWLLPQGSAYLQRQLGLSPDEAERALRTHTQVCYDICHFAVMYERPREVFTRWRAAGIRIGKIQISAALKAQLSSDISERKATTRAFESLVESTYLHQVIARREDGRLVHYPDLPEALPHIREPAAQEWRTHFHVPIFVAEYGALAATQSDIQEVLNILRTEPVTKHLEVETYTWEVLPPKIRVGLAESITRELRWVQNHYQT